MTMPRILLLPLLLLLVACEGPTGPAGPTGGTGAPGATGAQGPAGPPGITRLVFERDIPTPGTLVRFDIPLPAAAGTIQAPPVVACYILNTEGVLFVMPAHIEGECVLSGRPDGTLNIRVGIGSSQNRGYVGFRVVVIY